MTFNRPSPTRGSYSALPLLLLSTLASAQGGASLEFDSAVDSHRRLHDAAPRAAGPDADGSAGGGAAAADPEAAREGEGDDAGRVADDGADRERDAKPAGDRPVPVEPARATAPGDERTPEPAVPKAALGYDSAFADYVPYEETDGPKWIEANERVGEIGGWREYAKELYEPAPAADGEGAR